MAQEGLMVGLGVEEEDHLEAANLAFARRLGGACSLFQRGTAEQAPETIRAAGIPRPADGRWFPVGEPDAPRRHPP